MRQPHALTPWLLIGLAAGLLLAMMGLIDLRAPPKSLDDSVVASVGAHPISRSQYQEALAAVAEDQRDALSAATRRHVLDQLINEQLLAQYGRDLDLPMRSPRLRDALVDEVLSTIRLEAASQDIDYEQLRNYLAAHPERFRGPDLLHLRAWYAPDKATALTIRDALQAGEPLPAQQRAVLPDGPLPADKLRDYLGPTAAAEAGQLEAGAVSEPVPAGQRLLVMQLIERHASPTPALEAVEQAVREAVQRDRAEALLGERLEALRERYAVRVHDDAL